MKRYPGVQKGFSLVTTLFILVVLAVLGTYMSLMVGTQNQSTALSVQGVRASYAAFSGLEWTVYQINAAGTCPAVPALMSVEGFSVALNTCTEYPVLEAGCHYTVYDIEVSAQRGNFGDMNFVSRKTGLTMSGPCT